MRLYAIERDRLGHPYIEAVVTRAVVIQDYTKDLYTREQLEADDELCIALERWEEGNDRRQANDTCWRALKEQGLDVLHGIEDFREAAELAGDVDDFYCNAVRDIAAALEPARPILGSVLSEMVRDEQDRLVAEDGPSLGNV